MNARIVPLNHFTATVDPYGFDMECTFEWIEGEAPIYEPMDYAHPGSPSSCVLMACKVNGQDIYEMLNSKQIDRIEGAIVDQMEAV
jgi:hypothetical protein